MDAPPTPGNEYISEPIDTRTAIIHGADATPSSQTSQSERWDWTEVLPDTEHITLFKSIDWSSTRLGPLQSWSHTLRQSTYQVLADTRPACLYWYNPQSVLSHKYFPLTRPGARAMWLYTM